MKSLYKTKYIELKSAEFLPDSSWYYVKRTNDSALHDSAVVITTIVKVNNEYNFIFLVTKRPPLIAENKSKFSLESPAGLIGDENNSETLIECVKKELLEEVGIEAEKIYIEMTNSPTSGGLTSETISYVTVINDSYSVLSEPINDGGIIVDRILVPISNFNKFLCDANQNNFSISSSLIAGVYFAANRLNLMISE